MQPITSSTVATLKQAHERYISEAAMSHKISQAASSVPVESTSSPYAIDLTKVVSFDEIQSHHSSSPRSPRSSRFSGQHPNQHYRVSTYACSRLHSSGEHVGHCSNDVSTTELLSSSWDGLRTLKGKKGELFNKKVRIHLQRGRKRKSPGLSPRASSSDIKKEVTNPQNESEVILLIDSYLSEKISSTGFSFFQNSSPRSKEAAEEILEELKRKDTLMAPVRNYLDQIQKDLSSYIAQKGRKTAWVESLSVCLKNLLASGRDLDVFKERLKEIDDPAILSLLYDPLEQCQKGAISSSLFWSSPEGMEKLRGHYALLYVNYEDVQKIHQQKLFLKGGQIVPNTAVLTSRFVDFLKSISFLFINKTRICLETIKESAKFPKSFLFEFLKNFYELRRTIKSDSEILSEVKAIGRGETVFSTKLFWLCVTPWNEFHETIKLIFSPISPQIHVHLKEDLLKMTIAVEKGKYRVIKTVTYSCFYENCLIADITFNWSVAISELTPDESSTDWMNWEGCIQIPEPPRVKPHTPFEIKWLLLRQLSNFTDVSFVSSIFAKPLEKTSSQIEAYINDLEKKLHHPALMPQAEYISWYTLEYYVKGVCIKFVERDIKNKMAVEIPTLADEIWQQICMDGEILKPFLDRLEMFQTKLLKFMNDQPYRILDSDRLLNVIGRLLTNRDLGRFIEYLENCPLHVRVKSVLIHQLFGWGLQHSSASTSRVTSPQGHIEHVMKTLLIFNSGPEFLYSPLQQFAREVIDMKRQPTIHTPHQWIMSPEKTAALRGIPFSDVVRSLMVDGVPYIKKFIIFSKKREKGVTILRGDDFTGSKVENTHKYFSGLLNAMASYHEHLGVENVSEGVSYFMNPSLIDAEEKGRDRIPFFPILQLCSVNIQQNGDRFFRYLFNLNDAPLKTKVEQGQSIEIILGNNMQDYIVRHHFSVGVYERGIPERVDGGAIRRDRQLALIPIVWQICPYHENESAQERFLTTLQVDKNVKIYQKATPAHHHQIDKALKFYNSEFLENSDWENKVSTPEVVSPLGIPKILGKSPSRRLKSIYRTG